MRELEEGWPMSGVYAEEWVQPVIALLDHAQKKVRQYAEQAVLSMAKSAPKEMEAFLPDHLRERQARSVSDTEYPKEEPSLSIEELLAQLN